jgi:hypothetical protein
LRSSLRRGGVVLLVVASLAFAAPAGAAEDSQASSAFYSVAASSAPIGVEYFDAGAPVIPGEIVYGTVAVTRAAIDSVGNSAGFAAGPYLGDNVPALMGAFNAIGPLGAILPAYPFMVASQYPGNPKQVQDSGPRHLAATSTEDDSSGDAHVGLARGNPGVASVSSTSAAKHDPATGVLTAQADGVVQGFSLGSTLTIGQLTSHAEMTGRPGEQPVKKTSLSIGSLTVMGTLVGLTDKGLVPVPGTPKTADVNSLTKQLGAAGITLGLLPGEETPTSIDSAALIVGIAQKGPGGLTRVRIILGRVRAKVESSQAQA